MTISFPKWLILIIIVILLGMLLSTKNNLMDLVPSLSNFSTIENLEASMSRYTNTDHSGQSKFYIKFTYTNPSSFGAAFAGYPIFYLLDFKDNNNDIPDPNGNKKHPPTSELMTQKYLTKVNGTAIAPPVIQGGSTSDVESEYYTSLNDDYNKRSSTVTGSINEDNIISSGTKKYLLDITTFNNTNIQSGDKFWFGIALQSTALSSWGTDDLPYVYGNFNYTILTAKDPDGPDSINNFKVADGGSKFGYNY